MRTRVPILSLLAALSLSGCTLNTDYFGEYRGVNLLEDFDFDSMDGATPRWKTTTEVAGVDDYMTWEDIAVAATSEDADALTPTVGPNGKAAYRLEIKNLVPNGDFEDILVTPDGPWTPPAQWSGTGSIDAVFGTSFNDNGPPGGVFSIAGQTIDNRGLRFSSIAPGQQVTYNVTSGLGSLWVPGQYRIWFDVINASESQALGLALRNDLGDRIDAPEADPGGWNLTSVDGLGSLTTPATASITKTFAVPDPVEERRFVWGAGGSTEDAAILDNIRVVRSNIDLFVQTSFTSLSSGGLKLLPGTKAGAYRFTVYVRDDPTAVQTGTTSHKLNRFVAGEITVVIKGKAKNTSSLRELAAETFRRESGWPTWTKLTVEGGLDFVDSNEELYGQPALLVQITPTYVNSGTKDAGSLLVSEPKLTFNP